MIFTILATPRLQHHALPSILLGIQQRQRAAVPNTSPQRASTANAPPLALRHPNETLPPTLLHRRHSSATQTSPPMLLHHRRNTHSSPWPMPDGLVPLSLSLSLPPWWWLGLSPPLGWWLMRSFPWPGSPSFPRVRRSLLDSSIQFNAHRNNWMCIVSNFITRSGLVLNLIQL